MMIVFENEKTYKFGIKKQGDDSDLVEYQHKPKPVLLKGKTLMRDGYENFDDFIENGANEGFSQWQTVCICEVLNDGELKYLEEQTISKKADPKALNDNPLYPNMTQSSGRNSKDFDKAMSRIEESYKSQIAQQNSFIDSLKMENQDLREKLEGNIEEQVKIKSGQGLADFMTKYNENQIEELKDKVKKLEKEKETAEGLADQSQKMDYFLDMAKGFMPIAVGLANTGLQKLIPNFTPAQIDDQQQAPPQDPLQRQDPNNDLMEDL